MATDSPSARHPRRIARTATASGSARAAVSAATPSWHHDGRASVDRDRFSQPAICLESDGGELVAQDDLVPTTPEAHAAIDEPIQRDEIAPLQAGDPATAVRNAACYLVSQDDRRGAAGERVGRAGPDMVRSGSPLLAVGAADAGPLDLHPDLSVVWRWRVRYLLDPHVALAVP